MAKCYPDCKADINEHIKNINITQKEWSRITGGEKDFKSSYDKDDNQKNCKGTIKVTKECEPKCAEGYEKREQVKTICNLGNNEKGETTSKIKPAICYPKKCTISRSIKNGNTSKCYDTSSGSICEPVCNEGYYPIASKCIKGKWTYTTGSETIDHKPRCAPVTCKKPIQSDLLNYEYDTVCISNDRGKCGMDDHLDIVDKKKGDEIVNGVYKNHVQKKDLSGCYHKKPIGKIKDVKNCQGDQYYWTKFTKTSKEQCYKFATSRLGSLRYSKNNCPDQMIYIARPNVNVIKCHKNSSLVNKNKSPIIKCRIKGVEKDKGNYDIEKGIFETDYEVEGCKETTCIPELTHKYNEGTIKNKPLYKVENGVKQLNYEGNAEGDEYLYKEWLKDGRLRVQPSSISFKCKEGYKTIYISNQEYSTMNLSGVTYDKDKGNAKSDRRKYVCDKRDNLNYSKWYFEKEPCYPKGCFKKTDTTTTKILENGNGCKEDTVILKDGKKSEHIKDKETCKLTCKTGYEIVETPETVPNSIKKKEIKCDKGHWVDFKSNNSKKPKIDAEKAWPTNNYFSCKIARCNLGEWLTNNPFVTNTTKECSEYISHGKECDTKCKPGYKKKSAHKIKCEKGVITGPTCEPVPCIQNIKILQTGKTEKKFSCSGYDLNKTCKPTCPNPNNFSINGNSDSRTYKCTGIKEGESQWRINNTSYENKKNPDLIKIAKEQFRATPNQLNKIKGIKNEEEKKKNLIELIYSLERNIYCKRSSCFRKGGSGGKTIKNTVNITAKEENKGMKNTQNMKKKYKEDTFETICSGTGDCFYKCRTGYEVSNDSIQHKGMFNVGKVTCGGNNVYGNAECVIRPCNLKDNINLIKYKNNKSADYADSCRDSVNYGNSCSFKCGSGYKRKPPEGETSCDNFLYKCNINSEGQNIMKPSNSKTCRCIPSACPNTKYSEDSGYLFGTKETPPDMVTVLSENKNNIKTINKNLKCNKYYIQKGDKKPEITCKASPDNDNPYELNGCTKGICSSYNKDSEQPENTKPERFYIGIDKSKKFVCKDGYSTDGKFKRYKPETHKNDLGNEKKIITTCKKHSDKTKVFFQIGDNKKCLENSCENMNDQSKNSKWELIDKNGCKTTKGKTCNFKCGKGHTGKDTKANITCKMGEWREPVLNEIEIKGNCHISQKKNLKKSACNNDKNHIFFEQKCVEYHTNITNEQGCDENKNGLWFAGGGKCLKINTDKDQKLCGFKIIKPSDKCNEDDCQDKNYNTTYYHSVIGGGCTVVENSASPPSSTFKLKVGGECEIKCESGSEIKGKIKCEKGKLSNHTCTRFTCTKPSNTTGYKVKGTDKLPDKLNGQQSKNVKCADTYTLSGNAQAQAKAKCSGNKSEPYTLSGCKRELCNSLPLNTKKKDSRGSIGIGETETFDCKDGYSEDGKNESPKISIQSECLLNQQKNRNIGHKWDKNCKPNACKGVGDTWELTGKCNIKHNSECSFKCKKGYKSGRENIKCITGEWKKKDDRGNNPFSICTPNKCVLQKDLIKNGTFDCGGNGEKKGYNETCNVVCAPGYKLNNSKNIQYKCSIDPKGQNVMVPVSGNRAACIAVKCADMNTIVKTYIIPGCYSVDVSKTKANSCQETNERWFNGKCLVRNKKSRDDCKGDNKWMMGEVTTKFVCKGGNLAEACKPTCPNKNIFSINGKNDKHTYKCTGIKEGVSQWRLEGPTTDDVKVLTNLATEYGAPNSLITKITLSDKNDKQKGQDLINLIYRRIGIKYGALNQNLDNKNGEELIDYVHTLQQVIDCKRSSCFIKGGGKKIQNTIIITNTEENQGMKNTPNMKKEYKKDIFETICSGTGTCFYKCAPGYQLSNNSTKYKNMNNVGILTCGQGKSTFSSGSCDPLPCKVATTTTTITNGKLDCNGQHIKNHNQKCDVVCNSGYKLQNNNNKTYKCSVQGGKNIMVPDKKKAVCIPVKCKKPNHTTGYTGVPPNLTGDKKSVVRCSSTYTLSNQNETAKAKCLNKTDNNPYTLSGCKLEKCNSRPLNTKEKKSRKSIIGIGGTETFDCEDGFSEDGTNASQKISIQSKCLLNQQKNRNIGHKWDKNCKPNSCKKQGKKWVVISDDSNSTTSGTTHTIKCKNGYKGKQMTATCREGEWRKSKSDNTTIKDQLEGNCVEKDCVSNLGLTNGNEGDCTLDNSNKIILKHGETCYPKCNESYYIAGGVEGKISCNKGTLVKNGLSCNRIECTKPDNKYTTGYVSGYTKDKNNVMALDNKPITTTKNVDCNSKYIWNNKSKQPQAICNTNYSKPYKLSGCKKGICEYKDLEQGNANNSNALDYDDKGKITGGKNNPGIGVTEIFTFECKQGYTGSRKVRCDKIGNDKTEWKNITSCIPMDCDNHDALNKIRNVGTLTNPSPPGGSCPKNLKHNKTCDFKCKNGYTLNGEGKITCNAGKPEINGTCKESNCALPDSFFNNKDIQRGSCKTKTMKSLETCKPLCNPGYTFKKDKDVIKCDKSKLTTFPCVKINCPTMEVNNGTSKTTCNGALKTCRVSCPSGKTINGGSKQSRTYKCEGVMGSSPPSSQWKFDGDTFKDHTLTCKSTSCTRNGFSGGHIIYNTDTPNNSSGKKKYNSSNRSTTCSGKGDCYFKCMSGHKPYIDGTEIKTKTNGDFKISCDSSGYPDAKCVPNLCNLKDINKKKINGGSFTDGLCKGKNVVPHNTECNLICDNQENTYIANTADNDKGINKVTYKCTKGIMIAKEYIGRHTCKPVICDVPKNLTIPIELKNPTSRDKLPDNIECPENYHSTIEYQRIWANEKCYLKTTQNSKKECVSKGNYWDKKQTKCFLASKDKDQNNCKGKVNHIWEDNKCKLLNRATKKDECEKDTSYIGEITKCDFPDKANNPNPYRLSNCNPIKCNDPNTSGNKTPGYKTPTGTLDKKDIVSTVVKCDNGYYSDSEVKETSGTYYKGDITPCKKNNTQYLLSNCKPLCKTSDLKSNVQNNANRLNNVNGPFLGENITHNDSNKINAVQKDNSSVTVQCKPGFGIRLSSVRPEEGEKLGQRYDCIPDGTWKESEKCEKLCNENMYGSKTETYRGCNNKDRYNQTCQHWGCTWEKPQKGKEVGTCKDKSNKIYGVCSGIEQNECKGSKLFWKGNSCLSITEKCPDLIPNAMVTSTECKEIKGAWTENKFVNADADGIKDCIHWPGANTPRDKPNYGLDHYRSKMGYVIKENHNYCRNPNERKKGLWCFTKNKHIRYGSCNNPTSNKSGGYPNPPGTKIDYNTIKGFDKRIQSSNKIKQGLIF